MSDGNSVSGSCDSCKDSALSAHQAAGAVILCGGRSVRMGTDKSLLLIDGQPFLSYVCETIAPRFNMTIVVAAEDQRLPELPATVDVVRDAVLDAGPLAGLLTGLEELRQRDRPPEIIWLGCCDAPLVNLDVINRLLTMVDSRDAAVVRYAGRIQPLGGVYRTAILATVRRMIAAGERRLQQLPLALNTELINAEELRDLDPNLDCLKNINTPEDYQRYVTDR